MINFSLIGALEEQGDIKKPKINYNSSLSLINTTLSMCNQKIID